MANGNAPETRDATIAGSFVQSVATRGEGFVEAKITAVTENFGNIFTGFIQDDLHAIGLKTGDTFQLESGDQSVPVKWGTTYRDVQQGEWVSFISGEGNLMVAINRDDACKAIDCEVGDTLRISAD